MLLFRCKEIPARYQMFFRQIERNFRSFLFHGVFSVFVSQNQGLRLDEFYCGGIDRGENLSLVR